MQCYHPVTIRSPDGLIQVPCGSCFACQSNRRKEWVFRIKQEMKYSVCSYTVTLTYDDFHLPPLELFTPYSDSLNVSDDHSHDFYYHPYDISHLQLLFKRLRKCFKFRYFGVAEYGGKTARPHYHIIFFFKSAIDRSSFTKEVVRCWEHGCQIVVDVTDDSCIQYTLKYCLKLQNVKQPQPKIVCSKNPFIGYDYFSWNMLKFHMHSHDDTTLFDGKKIRLPRIYRRIYTDSLKDRNAAAALDRADECIKLDQISALEQGLSYGEFLQRKREAFTESCLKQLKSKTL